MAVKIKTFFHAMDGTVGTPFLEDSQAIDIQIPSRMPFYTIIPHLGIYPRERATQIYKGIYLSIACTF